MSSSNYSIYALPAFFIIALAPRAYGTSLIKSAIKDRFNANPRGQSVQSFCQKTLDAPTYAKWERAGAAHNNAMENIPLFFAAVILANMAQLDVGRVNTVCGAFLGFRVLHSVLYVGISDNALSRARTAAWAGSVGCCFYLLIKAGNALF